MLDKIRNQYTGANIAILGSAPSVKRFQRNEDIVIGVNGAGQLLQPNDIFLSGDQSAHTRSWFLDLDARIQCILKPHAAIYSERFFPEKIREQFVSAYEAYMDANPERVIETELGLRFTPSSDEVIQSLFTHLPDPIDPHLVMPIKGSGSKPVPISRSHQAQINSGGTSSCLALQIANVMGAREIHLYGIEFSNDITKNKPYQGRNYFYNANPGETGMTSSSQRKFMDDIISQVLEGGTKVISHGPTKLENSYKAD
jgi:hypothetical protein